MCPFRSHLERLLWAPCCVQGAGADTDTTRSALRGSPSSGEELKLHPKALEEPELDQDAWSCRVAEEAPLVPSAGPPHPSACAPATRGSWGPKPDAVWCRSVWVVSRSLPVRGEAMRERRNPTFSTPQAVFLKDFSSQLLRTEAHGRRVTFSQE